MAQVICNVVDCKHRSKRKLKNYKKQNGSPCYGCKLEVILVSDIFDPDGEIEAIAGKENMMICNNYESE